MFYNLIHIPCVCYLKFSFTEILYPSDKFIRQFMKLFLNTCFFCKLKMFMLTLT